jgi:hypothetical protein
LQSEIQLRRYRESLGLPDPTGATGAVIPLNDVIIASTQETLRALLVSVRLGSSGQMSSPHALLAGADAVVLQGSRRLRLVRCYHTPACLF